MCLFIDAAKAQNECMSIIRVSGEHTSKQKMHNKKITHRLGNEFFISDFHASSLGLFQLLFALFSAMLIRWVDGFAHF